MPKLCPAHRSKLPLAWLVLAPALALGACGRSKEATEMDAKLARAEAAVVRAEAAQHAAESAAVRARIDKIALASQIEIEPPQQSDQGGGDISMETSPNPPAIEP